MKKERFENLPIKQRALATDTPRAYRIYKSEKEFVVAHGASAGEALKASGVENALRVMLHDVREETVLQGNELRAEQAPEEKKPDAPKEAPAAEAPKEASA